MTITTLIEVEVIKDIYDGDKPYTMVYCSLALYGRCVRNIDG